MRSKYLKKGMVTMSKEEKKIRIVQLVVYSTILIDGVALRCGLETVDYYYLLFLFDTRTS